MCTARWLFSDEEAEEASTCDEDALALFAEAADCAWLCSRIERVSIFVQLRTKKEEEKMNYQFVVA